MNFVNEKILIMDFGGQYSQLIARRVRDCNVFCEIKPYKITAKEIAEGEYKGIIFSGGPNSVYEEKAPRCDAALFDLGIPVLGTVSYTHLDVYKRQVPPSLRPL